MKDGVNLFNLEFSGKILPGRDVTRARARFAEMFEVHSPTRLEHYFSGETFVLREKLDRKVAGEYFARMRKVGLEANLVKIATEAAQAEPAPTTDNTPATKEKPKTGSSTSRKQAAADRKRRRKSQAHERKQAQQAAKRKTRKQASSATAAQSETATAPPAKSTAAPPAKTTTAKTPATKARAKENPAGKTGTAGAQDAAASPAPGKAAARTASRAAKKPSARPKTETPASPAGKSPRQPAASASSKARADSAAKIPGKHSPTNTSGKRSAQSTPGKARKRAPITSRLILPGVLRRAAEPTKQRSGAPNPYRLHPFRNTPEVRGRAARAATGARRGLMWGTAALAVLLILAGSFIARHASAPLRGPAAVAAAPGGALVLLAGDKLLLHDRAGVPERRIEAAELGLRELAPPLLFVERELLLSARAADDDSVMQLWRCDLEAPQCTAFGADSAALDIVAIVHHALSGDFIVADASLPGLVKLDSKGGEKARTERELPANPVLRLDMGLLFVNSAEGPAISVLRFEDRAFGHQLDEILLLPPMAVEAGQDSVADFIRQDDNWWATLLNPDSGRADTYIFDNDWQLHRTLLRKDFAGAGDLVNWGQKVLLASDRQREVLRFNDRGKPEALFTSPLLDELIGGETSVRRAVDLGWYLALLACTTVTLLGLGYAAFNRYRWRVYRGHKAHGAQPLDAALERVSWLPEDPRRDTQLLLAVTVTGALGVVLLAVAAVLGTGVAGMAALLLVIGSTLAALLVLQRSGADHVGLLDRELVLVDHRETYHHSSGRGLQRRGPFLFIDDVMVYTGSPWLAALERGAVREQLEPRLADAAPAPLGALLVRLRESGHPLGQAGLLLATGLAFAALALLVGGLPW
ncbi:hypothetical protein E4634_10420 [Mangrovimicrobium sediminis]|uniref:Uncharacterized protein n=1 Tax=Mangrovimicrobium sediminis TaxID=2562682 RepID=A0A4Z0M1T0_9GAMM|nr:hypothetical protein [Haliea sp. SAOS-164]TGD73440.1 hypothetical protein E4634_10420 [Haliea sp. SAOS-164]